MRCCDDVMIQVDFVKIWMAGLFLFCLYVPPAEASIVLENDYFKYEVSEGGINLHFIDKTTGIDYLYRDSVSHCASIVQDGRTFNVTSVTLKASRLVYTFGKTGVTAELLVRNNHDHMILEVVDVKGTAESLTFLNIPLTLEGMPREPFAACALALNLRTQVRQLPALQTHLWAACYRCFGMKGAMVSLLGVPQKDILPVIRKVMAKAKDIPLSTAGGAWAQLRKEGYGSYLMNFGTLTEETVPEWIEMCNNLGFNQIDNHGGGSFFTFGDFELNPEKWPEGWVQFKRINERLHQAGISSIFHTYAFFIDKNSKYVTPVPHPDLGYFGSFTLAGPIGPDDTEIPVLESTAGISTITGFFVRNSLTLRIGDELVGFSGINQAPPYKFTGCKRGANGTRKTSHPASEKAYHLREMFGRFVPGVETPLFREIAHRTAEIINYCEFDGIYFDAIDGSDILAGAENSWYYGTRFIFEVARKLKRPVGMEMSTMFHHWWHYRSRWQAWDRPVRGYKRFVDIHSAAIKTQEHDHGLWRGYGPMIPKFSQVENGGLLLPLHLGWWGNQTWNPPQVEPTFSDDIEYLCCKMIGNNAGLSMLGGADKKTLDETPLFKRSVAIIKQYEELRQRGYFGDSVRTLLRQPGKEFTLVQDENREWHFKPVAWQKHKASGINAEPWTVTHEFGTQPVRLRIELLMSVKPYDDPGNMLLAGPGDTMDSLSRECAAGVTGGILSSTDKTDTGDAVFNFEAFSSGVSPRESAWIRIEKKFEPWLDLEKNQALGVWINGDGNGELLNLRIESPKHISYGARGDHFVKIDFTGWKYFELVEIESAESSDYIWPAPNTTSDFYVYDSYRHTVDFKHVDKLQLWCNNLPPGKEVSCRIGPVKALPMVAATIINPAVIINGERIVFPVQMEPGMFIEFNPASDCKLYGPKGELLKEMVITEKIPSLVPGKNKISFTCDAPGTVNPRVQVTVIGEGEPLENN